MGRRGKELSPQTRSRICELNSIGWGYKRIHNKHPEIPISTIKSTIYNEIWGANTVGGIKFSTPYLLPRLTAST